MKSLARLLTALCALTLAIAASAQTTAVVLYPGYGDASGFVAEGRVVEASDLQPTESGDGWTTNLWRNLRLLTVDEQAHAAVSVAVFDHTWNLVSDREGYFRVDAAFDTRVAPGWHALQASAGGSAGTGRVLVVPAENVHGVITDVDDTVLVSQVPSKLRLLANTLFKNPLQRQAVPGTVALLWRLCARNPAPEETALFYLSASPRQLAGNIDAFLSANRFPAGVLITKKITDDDTSEPLTNQFAYKTAKIAEIMHRVPHVRFTLIGDDGEQDPEAYHDIRTRFPERVDAVWIRKVSSDPQRRTYPEQRDLREAIAAFD